MKQYVKDNCIITGIICAFILSVYAIKGIYPFGNELMIWGDMTDQGIHYLYRAYDVLTGAVSPHFAWYLSGGIPLGYSFTPFHLLLLLTERENIYQFVSIIILARMVAMALAMYIFTCRYQVDRIWKIICSVLYGLGSCALIYHQIDYVMLDIAVLFPILMAGFYSLLKKRKPLLYIAVLALSIAHNIYVSYMVLLYLFSASILYFYFKIPREEFCERCSKLVLSTLLAIGISAFRWLPSLYGLSNSSRMETGTQGGLSGTYLRAMETISFFDLEHFIACVFFFLGSSLFLASISSSWKHLKGALLYHRFQLLLICLAMFIPGTELLWHGGSRTLWPVRFAFILNFVLIEVFLVIMHNRFLSFTQCQEREKTSSLIIAAIIGLVGLTACFMQFPTTNVTPAWIVLMMIFYRYILKGKLPYQKQAIISVLIIDTACSAFLWIAPVFHDTESSQDDALALAKTHSFWSAAAKFRHEIPPNLLEPAVRIRDYYSYFGPNYAMVTNTSSISNGLGTVPRYLIHYYNSLGYVDVVGNTEHMDQMTDTGGTVFTDALLNIRAVFTVNTLLDSKLYELDESVSMVHFYRNRYAFPFGIELHGEAMPKDNIFDFQNELFRAISGRSDELIHAHDENGKHLEIPVHGQNELYFYSDSKNKIRAISINGENVIITNGAFLDGTEYPRSLNCRVVDLGTFENETVILELDTDDDYDFSQVHIGLLDLGKMSETMAQLNEKNKNSEPETGSDFVNLKHISSDGGTLFLPIWYSKGWKCEVNGKACALSSVLGGWIGVPLEQGQNTIKMKFRPDTHWPSVYLSLASLLVGLCLFKIKQFNRLAILRKGLERITGSIYMILAAIFLILVYILPIPLGLWYTFTS